MKFRQTVTALRLVRPARLTTPLGDVQADKGDWLVWDSCGQMRTYKHEHFVQVFEPDDDEAQDLSRHLAFELLSKQAG
jgi:hypothetical protein